ncbi:CHASE2 domain-containing protein [Variovorax sp. KBS0712]|uniref:CHASE2 domain-containing protein n=1 Tax=Variovorax sp. KBS0712 TaxID=2578111 RepID=UPI00117DF73E|nr:CHASE2 domain-containing protein [Variovorax sp. KBS0712]TSD60427.1 CHASE2 domain-containing protein [Variovorax sp. KBS0712]
MRLVVERLLMALLLPLAMLGLAHRPGLLQMDAYIHDRLLILASHRASADILIIAIDEHSLRELGRWPWSRATHARLLERLAPAVPRAVLLDLFLTEPSADPREDAHLAQAMGLLPVYLPLLHASPWPSRATNGRASCHRCRTLPPRPAAWGMPASRQTPTAWRARCTCSRAIRTSCSPTWAR